jgi:hypothetical protein
MTLDGKSNQLRSDLCVLGDRQPQGGLHGILAVASCKLQDLQVFASGKLRAVSAEKFIVGHAEVTRGKHVGMILVVLQRAGLANQRVDHVPVIDRMFAIAEQARHGLNERPCPEDFNLVGVDHHIHLHADKPTGNRIRVALHLNRTAAIDLDSAQTMPMIELAGRQFTETILFLRKLAGAASVSPVNQLRKKLFVLCAAGEIAVAAQQECLVDDRLQVTVR